jgi:hypothetical protein
MEANCLQANIVFKGFVLQRQDVQVARATYDPRLRFPPLAPPARERVFIRMVIPAMRAQTCGPFCLCCRF